MDLSLRRTADGHVRRYRDYKAYLQGLSDANGGAPTSPEYKLRAAWVWAVEQTYSKLARHDPEKARFFQCFYHLDRPGPKGNRRTSEVIKLSYALNASPSTLYKWREQVLDMVILAAVQAGALEPF